MTMSLVHNSTRSLLGTLMGALLSMFMLVPDGARAGPTSATQAVYEPPDRDAPPARVSGGTRSTGRAEIDLRVLAPDHVGWTLSDQPTLYWYLSASVERTAVLTIVGEGSVDPLLDLRLEPPFAAGVHSVALSGRDVRLKAGETYHWGITLVSGSANPFKDAYAGGAIRLVTPSRALKANLAGTSEFERAGVLLESGVWYDAIDVLSSAIASAPQEKRFRDLRSQLMEQVGLPTVAAFDSARQLR